MFDQLALPVIGYHGERVPNTFVRQSDETHHLALLFPGYRYRATMPALYYVEWLLVAAGADVLRVETAYDLDRRFDAAGAEERRGWLCADAEAAWTAARTQRDYTRITLVGKSIGTQAMGCLLETQRDLQHAACIWLTPLMHDAALRAQIAATAPRSLFVAGTSDRHYDPVLLAELKTATGGASVLIPGANHSLELGDDVPASVSALANVMSAVSAFVHAAN